MNITANDMHYKILNDKVRLAECKDITIDNCIGQRYIASGLCDKKLVINGVPGNALGAYLNGAEIIVNGNAQDATGDTMNEGKIIINGSSGDATGYAMRGGKIYIKGNVGYRAGIHMKAYMDKFPVLVIGGKAGCFLGEYQAGGHIVVLGIDGDEKAPVGEFCGMGMHGGKIYLRCSEAPADLPKQVTARESTKEDIAEIEKDVSFFCETFGFNKDEILNHKFVVLMPDTKNPYKQLYTSN